MKSDEAIMRELQSKLRTKIAAGEPCGPFYAAVVAADGTIIAEAANSVVSANCSHNHAEMNAISLAERKLGTWNLAKRGLSLYTTAEPCMMCVGGILWSGIERIVYGVGTESVERITGFDEGFKPHWREEFGSRGISVSGPVVPEVGEEVLKLYMSRQGVVYSPHAQLPIVLFFASLLTFFGGCTAVHPESAISNVNQCGRDNLIAHRGESVDAPENTLPAYRTAVTRGFGFECDIYLSKDKRLFTFHDRDLRRTTDGANTNRCTDVSWSETVSKVNVGGWGKWRGSQYDPTSPALLSDVLELARDGRWIYIEVKGNDPTWVPYIKTALTQARRANPKNVLFISFSAAVCAELKRQLPEYRVYWLTSCIKNRNRPHEVRTPSEIIAQLRQIGADGVDIKFDASVVDAAYVKEIKAAGFSFHVWTIDDPKTAQAAFAAGAETLTTNRAAYLWEALSQKD